MDPYQQSYGYPPSNGTPASHPFVPTPPQTYHQQSGDGMTAFLNAAPTQFIGQQFVQGGQQYVQRFQERIGVLSGSVLNYHFAVNNEYVRTKLMIVLMPYLRRWNFSRLPEQIPGGPKFRAPRSDVNCPDLYIPIVAFYSYCVLGCLKDFVLDRFTTDLMYIKVYRGLFCWLIHICIFKILAYMMSMSSTLSFVESTCYTGYMFVLLTFQLLGSFFRSGYVSMIFWSYTGLSMGVFLVRSLKRLLHHEARHSGGDANRHNYLLLCLAAFQLILFYFMS